MARHFRQPSAAARRALSALLHASPARSRDRRGRRVQRRPVPADRNAGSAAARDAPAPRSRRTAPASAISRCRWWRRVAQTAERRDRRPVRRHLAADEGLGGYGHGLRHRALEAAMLGVPALGLGSVHFSELFALPATRRSTPLDWPMADLLDPAQRARFGSPMKRPGSPISPSCSPIPGSAMPTTCAGPRRCATIPTGNGARPASCSTCSAGSARSAGPIRCWRRSAPSPFSPAETRSRRPAGNSGRGASRSRNPPP